MAFLQRWSVVILAGRRMATHAACVGLCVLVAACSGGGGGGGSGGTATASTPPAIATQPQGSVVGDGAAASFAVGAAGTAPLTYQWSRDGAPIAGATASTFTLNAAQLGDSGARFSAVVTNAAGSAQSAVATLTVQAVPPALGNNTPTTISVVAGAVATFNVTATGSLPLAFQWRRGGVPIAGATATSYTTPATTLADQGAVFDVVVSNVAGTATSAPFTLAVSAAPVPPSAITLPQFFIARAGNAGTFTVSPQGTGPFSYQWYRDGQAIAGAQAASYVIANVLLSDNNAGFSVQVTNVAGAVASSVATLIVLPQPGLALVAGNAGGPGSLDGQGTTARLLGPTNIALDNAGNLFVSDASTVRKISASNNVTTLAGSPLSTGAADGTGSAATFRDLSGIAVDVFSGNVYVADRTGNTVRRITPAGVVTTLAGTDGVAGSADGTGSAASFNGPTGLGFDGSGNVYVADTGNHLIRKVTAAGVVTTIAGSAGQAGAVDATGSAARFNAPRNVAVDVSGIVYVADTGNNTIRKITAGNVVATLAGSASASGATDGVGSAARFAAPSGIGVDAAGNVYVSETGNQLLRKIAPGAVVTTLAGRAGTSGSADGTGGAARFATPLGLVADSAGDVFIADRDNVAVRSVSTSAVVATIVGAPAVPGSADGNGGAASFNQPVAVAVDSAMNAYVGDLLNATIRRISVGGDVTTLAGTAGAPGANDGIGAAARFATPQALALDGAGNLYVADKNNHTVRKVAPGGAVTTLAGSAGTPGSADGTGTAATFNGPGAIAVDAAGNVYVGDDNPTVRRITPAGVVTTLAGGAGRIGAVDGPGVVASFRAVRGIAVDAAGNLLVGDAGNATIRKVTPAGVVSTVAGTATVAGSVDGSASTARFTTPSGIAIDLNGNVFVADPGTHTVRRIDTVGNVTTVAGVPDGTRGVRLGALPGHLDRPTGLAIDRNGNLYVTDANGVIRVTLQ